MKICNITLLFITMLATVNSQGNETFLVCSQFENLVTFGMWEFFTFIDFVQYHKPKVTSQIWTGIKRTENDSLVLMPDNVTLEADLLTGWSIVDGHQHLGVGDCGIATLGTTAKIINMVPCVASNAAVLCFEENGLDSLKTTFYQCLPNVSKDVQIFPLVYVPLDFCVEWCKMNAQCLGTAVIGSGCKIYATSESNVSLAVRKPEESCECLPEPDIITSMRYAITYNLAGSYYDVGYCDLSETHLHQLHNVGIQPVQPVIPVTSVTSAISTYTTAPEVHGGNGSTQDTTILTVDPYLSCSTTEIEYINCSCEPLVRNYTEKEKLVFITKVLNNMTIISRTNSTKFLLRKISVADDRPSSKSIGILGGLLMGVLFSAVLISDMVTLFTQISKNLKKS